MRTRSRFGLSWLLLLGMALAVPVAMAGDRVIGRLLAGPRGLGATDAVWIWAPNTTSWTEPSAFVALRDIELPAEPRAATLAVMADEEYVIYLNGNLVGAGRYRPHDLLDVYDVGALLTPGRNRLVAELRSGRGVGGFFTVLEVELADGESIRVASDQEWQIGGQYPHRLWDLDAAPPRMRSAHVLGPAPFGRWGPRSIAASARPLLQDAHVGHPQDMSRVYWANTQGEWMRASILRPVYSDRVLADFGEPVTGFLVLQSADEQPSPALVYVGNDVPEPERVAPANVWIPIEGGDNWWLDSEPRRFRFVQVLGAGAIRSIQVYRLRDDAVAAWPPVTEANGGVFGLQPVRLRTPVEDGLWRRLHSIGDD